MDKLAQIVTFRWFFLPNCQKFMMGSSDCQECRSIVKFFLLSYLVYSQFWILFLFLFGWMIASLAKLQNFQKQTH